jgi:hypothetical protein
MALTLETVMRNTIADAVGAVFNSGTIDITSAADVLLATLTFGATAFAGSVAGVNTANAITKDSDIDATDTAAKCKFKTSAAALQMTGSCTVTGGGGQITFPTLSFVQHAECSMVSLTITCPAS